MADQLPESCSPDPSSTADSPLYRLRLKARRYPCRRRRVHGAQKFYAKNRNRFRRYKPSPWRALVTLRPIETWEYPPRKGTQLIVQTKRYQEGRKRNLDGRRASGEYVYGSIKERSFCGSPDPTLAAAIVPLMNAFDVFIPVDEGADTPVFCVVS
jgi:hypothetical protein